MKKTNKYIKIAIPLILFVLFITITLVLNFAVTVTKSKYYGNENFIKFSGNMYTTAGTLGVYTYDENDDTVSLLESSGKRTDLHRQSVFYLVDESGNKYISATAIVYQSIAALCYIVACVYICIVYKTQ